MPHCEGGHEQEGMGHGGDKSDSAVDTTVKDPVAATGDNPSSGGSGFATMSGGRRSKSKSKGKKRGMNNFFKLMLAAKKKKSPSFEYNGTTYYGHPHPMLGMVYKKSKSPLKDVDAGKVKTKKAKRKSGKKGKTRKKRRKSRGKSKRKSKGKKRRRSKRRR